MKTNITDNITIREVRISDSQKIYNAIHLHREYLQEWLPFVTFLTAEEEKAFLSSVLRVPRARRDFIYIIEEKQEVCGLIGFHYSDAANLRTEIGYWLLPKYQHRGIMTKCVRHLCRIAVEERGMNASKSVAPKETLPAMPSRKDSASTWKELNATGN